jgi:hypothetical protein
MECEEVGFIGAAGLEFGGESCGELVRRTAAAQSSFEALSLLLDRGKKLRAATCPRQSRRFPSVSRPDEVCSSAGADMTALGFRTRFIACLLLAAAGYVTRAQSSPPTIPIEVGLLVDGQWSVPDASRVFAGTAGEGKPATGFYIRAGGLPIFFRTHFSGIGWLPWVVADAMQCAPGHRLEAVQFAFPTAHWPDGWELFADVHVEGIGWRGPVCINSGSYIGTIGEARRLEAIQLYLMKPLGNTLCRVAPRLPTQPYEVHSQPFEPITADQIQEIVGTIPDLHGSQPIPGFDDNRRPAFARALSTEPGRQQAIREDQDMLAGKAAMDACRADLKNPDAVLTTLKLLNADRPPSTPASQGQPPQTQAH